MVFKLMVKDSAEGMPIDPALDKLLIHFRADYANRQEEACARPFDCAKDG